MHNMILLANSPSNYFKTGMFPFIMAVLALRMQLTVPPDFVSHISKVASCF